MKLKITFLLLFLVFGFSFGQTTLGAGDIAITGFNSDTPDQFSFVLLTNIATGTIIKFTDNGQQTIDYNITDEGVITWTANTDLSCGTEIIIEDIGGNNYSASSGIAAETGLGFALANAGDQILAYQGLDLSPTFIYAITYGPTSWSDADDTQTTILPIGLTDGQDAVYVGNDENGTYNCSTTTNQSLILTAISTDTNWTLSNTPVIIGGCTYTCVACPTSITWSGGVWSNGTGPNSNIGAIIDDVYNTGTDGSFSACSLIVNAGNTLTVTNNRFIEIENDITINGTLTVNSQGSVVQNNDNAVFSNSNIVTLTKSKIMQNAISYTYWSSPVNTETIDNTFGTTPVDRRFEFIAANFVDTQTEIGNSNTFTPGPDDIDDDGNDWHLKSSGVMTPGIGYAIMPAPILGPGNFPIQQSFTFSGAFNNGVITTSLVNNSGGAYNDWNFIGNPYPSAIDADQFFTINAGLVDVIYLWDQATPPDANSGGNQGSNFSNDDYAIINGTGTVQGARGGLGTPPDRYIPSGQGFFVEALAAGNVTFNNSMRVIGNNTQFFRIAEKKTIPNRLWLNLLTDNDAFNQILIGYVDGASGDLDPTFYDTPKNLSVNASATLYSNIEGSNKKFAIQGKAPSNLTLEEIINIGYKTTINVPTIYTLSIAQLEGEFLINNPIYLKDNLLNKIHNLKDSDYNFTSEVGEFNNRFEIVFSEDALSVNYFNLDKDALSIIEHKNGNVQFKLSAPNKISNIKIIDLQGRVLYDFELDSKDEILKLSNLNQVPYIAKVTLDNNNVITKKAIKKY